MKLFVIATTVCASAWSIGQTYNILDSFTTGSPNNAPWRLGWRPAFGGTAFNSMTVENQVAFPNGLAEHWTIGEVGNSAFGFYRNFNSFDLVGNDVALSRIPANDWGIHPENFNGRGDMVCRFVAPASASYNINYSAARLSQFAGSVKVGLLHAGTLLDSVVLTSDGYLYHARPTASLFLAAGDYIDFDVSSDGNTQGDLTGLRGTVTTVPEPSMLLAALALAPLVLRRRPLAQKMTNL